MYDVEENDADLVVGRHGLVQQDGHDVPHVILHLLTLSISAHGKVLAGEKYVVEMDTCT